MSASARSSSDFPRNHSGFALTGAFERILDEFDTEVGIPSANTEKKERMNVAEVNVNNIESVTRLTTWIETMQKDAKVANTIFPDLNLKVKMRKFEQEERLIPYDE
jgi:hypothetical protein